MHRINLLYVITKLELGGAQKNVLNLISRLDLERFRPFLFTAREGMLSAEAQALPGLTVKRSSYLERPINPLKDSLALIELYRFIKENKIDIVHTHSSKAGIIGRLAARFAGVRHILHTVHGWSFNDYQPRLLRALFIWLEKFTAEFTDRLITVSRHDKQKGLRLGIGSENKYVLIRYGIDCADFYAQGAADIRKELGIGPDDFVIGTVSCLKPQKAPENFIRLAGIVNRSLRDSGAASPGCRRRNGQVKFIIVGDGALRGKVERLISRLDLESRVILTGWRRDVPRILSAVDIFVLTSLWEGLPVSVLEAMRSCRPVIASDTGGVTEVVLDGETGFITPAGDTKYMSERVLSLLGDEGMRREFGRRAGASLGPEFTLEFMVEDTQRIYRSFIPEGGRENAN